MTEVVEFGFASLTQYESLKVIRGDKKQLSIYLVIYCKVFSLWRLDFDSDWNCIFLMVWKGIQRANGLFIIIENPFILYINDISKTDFKVRI